MLDDVACGSINQVEHHEALKLMNQVVSAFVLNKALPDVELDSLISAVHQAVVDLDSLTTLGVPQPQKATFDQIVRSITCEALISFEDGKTYKTLKRHLRARGLSPEAYRSKHGLPTDYPMTAPSYSARRSAIATKRVLGQR